MRGNPPGGRASGASTPPVYPTGCAGRITAFAETDDGRYLITLTGVSRFRIRDELPLLSGYRRVVPDWRAFAQDLHAPGAARFDPDRLILGPQGVFAPRQNSADCAAIAKAAGEHPSPSLPIACPLA